MILVMKLECDHVGWLASSSVLPPTCLDGWCFRVSSHLAISLAAYCVGSCLCEHHVGLCFHMSMLSFGARACCMSTCYALQRPKAKTISMLSSTAYILPVIKLSS